MPRIEPQIVARYVAGRVPRDPPVTVGEGRQLIQRIDADAVRQQNRAGQPRLHVAFPVPCVGSTAVAIFNKKEEYDLFPARRALMIRPDRARRATQDPQMPSRLRAIAACATWGAISQT
jgi:hypothetical protein